MVEVTISDKIDFLFLIRFPDFHDGIWDGIHVFTKDGLHPDSDEVAWALLKYFKSETRDVDGLSEGGFDAA